MRSPSACDPAAERTCVFLSVTRDDQSVTVEMSGPSKGYLSFALSHDRWMVGTSHDIRGGDFSPGVSSAQWRVSCWFQSQMHMREGWEGRAGDEAVILLL